MVLEPFGSWKDLLGVPVTDVKVGTPSESLSFLYISLILLATGFLWARLSCQSGSCFMTTLPFGKVPAYA